MFPSLFSLCVCARACLNKHFLGDIMKQTGMGRKSEKLLVEGKRNVYAQVTEIIHCEFDWENIFMVT